MDATTPEAFVQWSERLRQGDRTAYRAVFEATHDPLYRYAWRFTRDADAAYDVLQDVFMKLWLIHDRIDPDRSLKALLYQMVRNYALNHERYKQRHATEPLEDVAYETGEASTITAEIDASDLEAQLRRWIADMPNRRREAFMLSRYEGLTHDEIARIMGLTPKTVNNHIVLALQYLRARRDALQSGAP